MAYPWPQSNQRGIETVGRPGQQHGPLEPQSNQRGIETGGGPGAAAGRRWASIEPAWD